MTLRIKTASREDFESFFTAHASGANRIRQKDVDEWFYLNGAAPSHNLLHRSAALNDTTRAILDEEGTVLCLFGLVESTGWLIGTDKGQKRAKAIHRFHKGYLEGQGRVILAFTIYPEDDRWHKALGFEHVAILNDGTIPVRVYRKEGTQWVS